MYEENALITVKECSGPKRFTGKWGAGSFWEAETVKKDFFSNDRPNYKAVKRVRRTGASGGIASH